MNEMRNANDGKILFREKESGIKEFELPSNTEIITAIKTAKKTALEDAKKMGMVFRPADIALCELKQPKRNETNTEMKILSDDDSIDDTSDDDSDFSDANSDEFNEVDNEDLDEDSGLSTNEPNHSRFVQINTEDSDIKEIRKSRYIWLLTTDRKKLSSDRLQRVKQHSDKPKRKRRRSE